MSSFTSPEKSDQIARRKAEGSRGGRPPAFDPERYADRNVVERCFNRLEQIRDLACGRRERVTSRDLHVLTDEAADPASPYWPDNRFGAWRSGTRGRLLMQRAMWTMLVVMLGVLPQHCSEVVGTDDQKMVEALPRSDPMNRPTIAFARDARTGVQMIRMSAPVNTVSKAVGNLLSRSRIKNRTTQPGRRGP